MSPQDPNQVAAHTMPFPPFDLAAERAGHESVLVARGARHAAGGRGTAGVMEPMTAAAPDAHHEPRAAADRARSFPRAAARRAAEHGPELRPLVQRHDLLGAAEVPAVHEEPRRQGERARAAAVVILLPLPAAHQQRPELLPVGRVHGDVALQERDAEALQQAAHAGAVLERLAHAADRRGVEHHRALAARGAPQLERLQGVRDARSSSFAAAAAPVPVAVLAIVDVVVVAAFGRLEGLRVGVDGAAEGGEEVRVEERRRGEVRPAVACGAISGLLAVVVGAELHLLGLARGDTRRDVLLVVVVIASAAGHLGRSPRFIDQRRLLRRRFLEVAAARRRGRLRRGPGTERQREEEVGRLRGGVGEGLQGPEDPRSEASHFSSPPSTLTDSLTHSRPEVGCDRHSQVAVAGRC